MHACVCVSVCLSVCLSIYVHLVHKRLYFAAQLRADLEKMKDELERNQRKYDTEIEVRDKQIYQRKALMAHFKKVCSVVA